jgi:hypothetical protein
MVQHHGHEPPGDELKRGLDAGRRMMVSAFRDCFEIDFDDLRLWDFVQHLDVRQLLNECEEFLKRGNPVLSMIGCKLARSKILTAIRIHTHDYNEDLFPTLFPIDMRHCVRDSLGEVGEVLLEFVESTHEQLLALRTEVLLVGLGLPTLDTRRFLQAQGFTSESVFTDGQMDVNISGNGSAEEVKEIAVFMLNYIYRLLRALGDSMESVLSTVTVKVPLSQQGIAKPPTGSVESED